MSIPNKEYGCEHIRTGPPISAKYCIFSELAEEEDRIVQKLLHIGFTQYQDKTEDSDIVFFLAGIVPNMQEVWQKKDQELWEGHPLLDEVRELKKPIFIVIDSPEGLLVKRSFHDKLRY